MQNNNMMNALVIHGKQDYRYEQIPMPVPGPGEILLQVKGCGVCAGDMKIYSGKSDIWDDPETSILQPPCSPGHEFCGVVCALGEGVTEYQIGDFLVTEQLVPCGKCVDCRRGMHWLCPELQVFGLNQYVNGGFAEYVRLPANSKIHRIPADFTVEQAALVEPMACGMHAAERAQVQHEDVVVVAGMGPIGLSIVNVLRLSLPKLLIALDTNPHRLQMSLEFGADIALNPLECDLDAEIRKLTDGVGCDAYIEASGFPASVGQGLQILRTRGRYVQFGVQAYPVPTDWNIIGDGKELTILGSHLSALCYPAVIRGIQTGLLRTEGLISHTFSLSQWQEGFETPKVDKNAMKILITP